MCANCGRVSAYVQKNEKMSIQQICDELGISRGTYYNAKKLPGFPSVVNLDNVREFLIASGKLRGQVPNGEEVEEKKNWRLELDKYKAINERQKSIQGKADIIAAAKEEILDEARKFLTRLKKKFIRSSYHLLTLAKSTRQLRTA